MFHAFHNDKVCGNGGDAGGMVDCVVSIVPFFLLDDNRLVLLGELLALLAQVHVAALALFVVSWE